MKARKIMGALVVIGALFGCQRGENVKIPDNLIGIWKTSEPKYEGRFFGLTGDRIILGLGEGRVDLFTIMAIRKTSQDKKTVYTISYVDSEGEQYKLSFLWEPTVPDEIRFKNQQQIVWTRPRR